MSIQSETNREQYVGNDSTVTAYPIPFLFFSNNDIVVVHADAEGNETTLTSAQLTITGAGNASGGEFTTSTAYPSTDKITVLRVVPLTQLTDYVNLDAFPAESHEQALDRIVMGLQQLAQSVAGAFRVSKSSPPFSEIISKPNTTVGFDANRDLVVLDGSELQALLNLPANVLDQPTKIWADDAARAVAVPDFRGQLGVQLNEFSLWIATNPVAGSWFKPFTQLQQLDTFVTGTQLNLMKVKVDNIEFDAAADQTGTEIVAAIDAELGDSWKQGLETFLAQDKKATTVDGGTFSSGSWQTRDLNTVDRNDITGASLASNQITLPAGTYVVDASAPAYKVNGHQARLYDVTNSAVLGYGENAYTSSASGIVTRSRVVAEITLSAATIIKLEHRAQSTHSSFGFGFANDFGGDEIYSTIKIQKVA